MPDSPGARWVFPTLAEHGFTRGTPEAASLTSLAEAAAYLSITELRWN
jgi:hypothetical protein